MKVSVVRSTLILFLVSYFSVSVWSGSQILAGAGDASVQNDVQMTLALSYVNTNYKAAAGALK